jgi:hypothetical protein
MIDTDTTASWMDNGWDSIDFGVRIVEDEYNGTFAANGLVVAVAVAVVVVVQVTAFVIEIEIGAVAYDKNQDTVVLCSANREFVASLKNQIY